MRGATDEIGPASQAAAVLSSDAIPIMPTTPKKNTCFLFRFHPAVSGVYIFALS